MDDYDFSVVIPTFNSETVVESAIASIQQQSGVRVQVIVVDGASGDRTCEIVRAIAPPNLVLVSEADRGIYDAINKGVALARGTLIGVLGSDDSYFADALPIALAEHRRSGAGIIAGRTRIGGTLRADEPYGVNALISGIPFGHNAMFATPQTYALVGDYDLRYRICADADWVHRAIRKGVVCDIVEANFVEFGTGGESSIQAERIMEETYSIIASNFPGLTKDEARRLLYAARRWAPSTSIVDIAAKYADDMVLIGAIAVAFPEGLPTTEAARPADGFRRFLRSSRAALSARFRQ